jgi:hypothetical protein
VTVVSDQTSSTPTANDVLTRATPAAAAATPDDVLASLKDAATRLEEIIHVAPSVKYQKVDVNPCAVFLIYPIEAYQRMVRAVTEIQHRRFRGWRSKAGGSARHGA